jgi:hypothetical protein
VYVVGELEPAGLELLRPLRGRVLLASAAQSLRRAGFLAELGWERLRSGPDDANRLAPAYGGQPQGAEPPGPVAPEPQPATPPDEPATQTTPAQVPAAVSDSATAGEAAPAPTPSPENPA